MVSKESSNNDIMLGLSGKDRVELILMVVSLRRRLESIDKDGIAYQKYCHNCNKVIR